MLLRTVFLFSLLFAASVMSAQDKKADAVFSGALESVINLDGALWNTSGDDFLSGERLKFFKWNSEQKDSARAPRYSNTPDMTFLGKKVYECIFRFEDGKVSSVYISLYNRGDAGNIESGSVLQKTIGGFKESIGKWTGVEGSKAQKDKIAKANVYSITWKKGDVELSMKWSYSGRLSEKSGRTSDDFRAEYIKLDITKNASASGNDKTSGSKDDASAKSSSSKNGGLKENLKNENNDVYIADIPMVDQGQKGYCVVAVVERVLRYYGQDIDQHQIAQKAGTENSGTSLSEFEKALKSLGKSLGVKYKSLYESEIAKIGEQAERGDLRCIPDTMKLVSQYNRYAKKAGCSKVDKNKYINGNMYDIGGMMNAMKPEGLKMLKVEGDKSAYARFTKQIKEYINLGIPILWSVRLGMVQEEKLNPQVNGGHMRLIIGYNEKDKKFIYSDTWGADHTFKKMTMDDAWLMTTGAYVLIPRRN
ncbi:MAG: hypothetical protein A2020_01630 [Lentisphaerae bacterium GWF2_45_14]|nr:MAG: hypothetical protein A2020_01630 [Lentisphaerae bacterium GWF2_45_14]